MSLSNVTSPDRAVRLERIAIVVASAVYLLVFNRTTPHGDALRVVRQIENGELIWNPNHLVFDPLGYAWYAVLKAAGVPISPLGSFEIIAGVAAIASLLVFHALLQRMGVRRPDIRMLATCGLFASQAFLTMATSQYYFMVQMPLLLGALYYLVEFAAAEDSRGDVASPLRRVGVLTAAAGAVTFNDVLLAGALGVAAALPRKGQNGWNWGNLASVWGPAAALGFPLFLLGYGLSDTASGFVEWLTSYEGSSGTKLTSFYGMEWTVRGVAVSLARATFNLLSAAVVETAGIGTALRVAVLREPLEFVPETSKVVLTTLVAPVVTLGLSALLIWMLLRSPKDRLAQFGTAWIGALFLFNVLWNSTGGQFWVQVLPVLWITLANNLAGVHPFRDGGTGVHWGRHGWKYVATGFAVPALLVVNTLQTVIPVSWVDLDALRTQHMSLLRDGDLEILPGWDGLGWVQVEDGGPEVTRETLMDMALQADTNERHIRHLPELVDRQLSTGRRVIVGRLYDKDRGINPWYGLARLGWSRNKIQELLSRFCHQEIGTVDDVVFQEIRSCNP